jgi:lipid-A-disaccharide synthase
LVDREPSPSRQEARARLGVAEDSRLLGIFPGSRVQEIRRLWEPFRDAALQLLKDGSCDRVFVAGIPAGHYPDPGPIQVLQGDPAPLFAAADAALAKSGTTTLEAALADTPMVVAYKVHPVTYAMFQRVRTVRWVSLVNLVAGREVVPEILQDRATATALANAVRPLLNPVDPGTLAQREGLARGRAPPRRRRPHDPCCRISR